MEGQDKQLESNVPFKEEGEQQNYQKLKRQYKSLREEYLKLLENWEDTHRKAKALSKEKKFLKEKLECFLKSQHYNISDEALTAAIMAKNNDIAPGQSLTHTSIAKQSSIQSGVYQGSNNNSAQQMNNQNHQKRKKKDSMHHQYGINQHLQPPMNIFGTQDNSKPHYQPPNHEHGQHLNQHQQMNMNPPPQYLEQQVPQQQQQPRIFSTIPNGNRDQGPMFQKIPNQQQPTMKTEIPMSIPPPVIKQIGQQQIQ